MLTGLVIEMNNEYTVVFQHCILSVIITYIDDDALEWELAEYENIPSVALLDQLIKENHNDEITELLVDAYEERIATNKAVDEFNEVA